MYIKPTAVAAAYVIVMFTHIMTNKWTITFIILSFIFGTILGGAGVSVYIGNTISNSMVILSMKNRAEWATSAFNAYKDWGADQAKHLILGQMISQIGLILGL